MQPKQAQVSTPVPYCMYLCIFLVCFLPTDLLPVSNNQPIAVVDLYATPMQIQLLWNHDHMAIV